MEVVPLWIEKTEDIRNDPKSLELLGGGWIADMWGYTCAAAELGLRHKLRALARSQGRIKPICRSYTTATLHPVPNTIGTGTSGTTDLGKESRIRLRSSFS